VRPAPGSRQGLALGVGLAVMLMWGASFTAQKEIFAAMSIGGYLFARYALLAPCALAVLLVATKARRPTLTPAEWGGVVRAGLVGPFGQVAVVSYGIDLSTAFSSSLLVACGPVFTLLILHLLSAERLRRAQVLGVAIAFGGIIVFLWDKLSRADWTAGFGDAMVLSGTVLLSLYTVMIRPLVSRHGAVPVICATNLVAAVPMMLLGGVAAAVVRWQAISPSIWLAFAWVVFMVTFVGWIAWGWVNSERGVARSAPLLYLMPPVAGVVAWWASGETFSLPKLVGAAIAMAGVALAQWAEWR
jgi:drug/metabolite transporter (DMT)-like permease